MHVPSTNQIYFSMYLYAQEQQLPLGPGIEWKLNNKTFRKSVMISQVSFVQIQWLQMVQESDICCDSNGNRIQMQNAYFQNEIEMNGYKIDGYIKRDGVNVFFEFLGCKFHPGCCVPDVNIENACLKRQTWLMKKNWLESNGELHIMRECQWRTMLSNTPESFLPKTDIPRVLLTDTKG